MRAPAALRVWVATALLAADPSGPPAPESGAGGFQELENGLKWKLLHVPGSRHVAGFLFVRVGAVHDPAGRTGLAHLLERCLAGAATAGTPARTRAELAAWRPLGAGSATRGACTVFWAVGDLDQAPEDLAWLAGLLSTARVAEEDLVREKVAVLERIHEATSVLPGEMLRWRARAALLGGGPQGRPFVGVPEQVRAVTLEELEERRRRLYTPRNSFLVLAGGLEEEAAGDLVRARFASLAPGEAPPPAPVAVPVPAAPASEPYARVGAPFVTAAFRAPPPGHVDLPAFLAVAGALGARAASLYLDRTAAGPVGFRGRGMEIEARFPPLLYPWPEEVDLLLVNRRGRDGQGLQETRAELERWLSEVAEGGLSGAELRAGALAFESMTGAPPPPRILLAARRQPRMLYPLGMAAGMAEVLGLPADLGPRLSAVTGEDAHRVLRAWLAPEKARWFSLVPE